jgi:hypothetical protein
LPLRGRRYVIGLARFVVALPLAFVRTDGFYAVQIAGYAQAKQPTIKTGESVAGNSVANRFTISHEKFLPLDATGMGADCGGF